MHVETRTMHVQTRIVYTYNTYDHLNIYIYTQTCFYESLHANIYIYNHTNIYIYIYAVC